MIRSNKFIFFWVYLLPVPLCAALFVYWTHASRQWLFALFAVALPAIYGYVIPGIATNVLKKWRFHGPGLIGNYFVHHGFKYASHLNLSLFIAFGDMPAHPTLWRYLSACFCTAFIEGFIVWVHDTRLIRNGILEILTVKGLGLSPEQITFRYAPLSFFLIGFTYAAGVLLAYDALVVAGDAHWSTFFLYLLLGFLLMATLPSLAYGYVERRRAGAVAP